MNNTGRITTDTIRYNLTNHKQITFEVTDDCNLKCKYCAFGEMYCGYDERISKYMSFNRQIEFLMSRTQKLKGLSAASLRLKTFNDNP